MKTDKEVFLLASKNLSIGESLGYKKGSNYLKTAYHKFNNLIKCSNDNRIISGSYINLCKIENLLNIKSGLSKNADVNITEDIFNRCIYYIEKAKEYNYNNSNLIAYKVHIYISQGIYSKAIEILKYATIKDISILKNFTLLDLKLIFTKLQVEDKSKYLNRDRIEFFEEFYKITNNIDATTSEDKFIVFEVSKKIVSILAILHKNICRECPNRVIDFYKMVEENHEELLPNIVTIVGASCIAEQKWIYLEEFINRCLNNKYCLNSSTNQIQVVGYKSYLHTAYMGQGKYDECRKIDNESLKIVKNNTTLHNAGNTMFKLKKYEKAIKYIKQALFIYEDECSYKLLGDCYFESNNFEYAIKFYIKSVMFISENSTSFTKKDGDMIVRSISLDDGLDMKIQLYESIINSYINLKDYSTALAYNTIAMKEFIHEDSFRMMDKLLNNFVEIVNEQELRAIKLQTVELELIKQKEYTEKALDKVSKWAEEIMEIQDIEYTLDEYDFEKLENKLLEIAETMKSKTSVHNVSYNKLRRELLNRYKGIENKSLDFLSTGEFLYLANEGQMIDYAPIMLEFCKVIELELNAYLKKVLGVSYCYTLGTLNRNVSKWNNKNLKERLEIITEYRNDSAHSGMVDRKKVNYVRELLYEKELINELINMKKRAKLNKEDIKII